MLNIEWTIPEPTRAAGQLLVVPLTTIDLKAIETRFGGAVKKAVDDAPFEAKPGESFAFTVEQDGALCRVALVGLGTGSLTAEAVRRLGHDIVRQAQGNGEHHVILDVRAGVLAGFDPARLGNLLAQGFELGTYAYERFLSDPPTRSVERISVWADDMSGSEGTSRGQIIASAIALGRDLANGPGELVTPSFLAQTARDLVADLSGQADVSVKILERADCEERNMGCFLGVAKGSAEPPKFIHLTYQPQGKRHGRIALIGKGVTFDSGGYSLKPTSGMLDMKMDMSGAANVLGTFEGAVRLGVPWELHVIVAATENMIGARAYRLGDVLTASNGKTVEINNTDAEGRLTLADALVYASELAPDLMIDLATLTGACMIALGPKIAGVMSHDEPLVEEWMGAAKRAGEAMWHLPLPPDLKDQLKSKVADLRNTGERYGGALTAGLFLSEFTGGKRWLHVDIAGPSIVSKPYGVASAGGSGFGVATLLELLSGEIRGPA